MKAIIFDLDGTILDTLEDLKNAVNHALFSLNFPLKDLEFVRKAIGNGTQVLIRRCVPSNTNENDYQKAFKIFKEYYFNHYTDNTKPYHGILNLIKGLKGKCFLAVVSNKDHDLTTNLIRKEFGDLFDIVQGSYFDKPKKPNPFLIEKVIDQLGVNKNDCLYVGDTNIDKESATNAGLKYCLVSYGYRNIDELEKMCPNDTPLATVDDLTNYLNKWVNL